MAKPLAPKALGAPLGMYSHGMVSPPGEIVVVAGQVGVAADGQVAVGDVVAQTKQALANVRAVVEAAGCTMRDVVRLQTFLTRTEDIPGFMKARSEVFPHYFPDGVYPPNTLLVVSRLVRPELLVEIEAMAVRGAKPASASSRRRATRRASAPARRRR
ncbi:MAG TPA: RidA family protein [Candidatus Binatia bacterium]|nr:RidA family protein [Candidatus Binatia bacterium]